MMRAVLLVAAVLAVSGCSVVGYPSGAPAPPFPASGGNPDSRQASVGDGSAATQAGESDAGADEGLDAVPDAVPRAEPLSRYGNPDEYEVDGRTYRVLDTSEGYEEEGLASWYGSEFQGRRTSSGEPYDMYLMTAAHRTLPIPTYVRVTNLENGRSVVVRVNDRGPFHSDRIIDLSFVAARKLGVVGPGTARVRVRALAPSQSRGAGGG